ncbi:hypothetical protein [Actinacidiphila sp. bgisy160]|uniref:hypothetical protein n=1 Tax=Actinacidiphila sp. bgisy160 TaxID=3413796 RepID=UPI003D72655E
MGSKYCRRVGFRIGIEAAAPLDVFTADLYLEVAWKHKASGDSISCGVGLLVFKALRRRSCCAACGVPQAVSMEH